MHTYIHTYNKTRLHARTQKGSQGVQNLPAEKSQSLGILNNTGLAPEKLQGYQARIQF